MISLNTFLYEHTATYEERAEFYEAFVKQLAKPLGSDTQDILHGCVGCATEAGELLDIAKKIWVYGQTLNTPHKEDGKSNGHHLIEELGDLLFYMQHVMNVCNISWENVIDHNVAKLSKRYKDGYSDAAAAARADKAGT
jgi:NTP pyrophosphatase (non-canonical NTP hydrolase)